jgi:exodeoxyribonuclease-3
MNKGFADYFKSEAADLFAIQETKMQEDQKSFHFPGYQEHWNSAERKGYSGTLIYAREKPLSICYGLEDGRYNDEGRIITLEYDPYFFVNVYVPNSQEGLARLDYRMTFEHDFREYLIRLDEQKPVILCGDLNVAHQPIDLKNPKANEKNAGYSIEERTQFKHLLESGFVDTFRTLYPEKVSYSWWSYLFNARKNNAGWRIDYFVVSARIMSRVKDSRIQSEVLGSDHCPVVLEIDI